MVSTCFSSMCTISRFIILIQIRINHIMNDVVFSNGFLCSERKFAKLELMKKISLCLSDVRSARDTALKACACHIRWESTPSIRNDITLPPWSSRARLKRRASGTSSARRYQDHRTLPRVSCRKRIREVPNPNCIHRVVHHMCTTSGLRLTIVFDRRS